MEILSKIWKWTKIVAGIIFGIAVAIITFGLFRKGPQPPDTGKVDEIERQTEHDLQEAARLDQERKDKEKEIEDNAEDTKEKLEEIEKREDKPGDIAHSVDELGKTW